MEDYPIWIDMMEEPGVNMEVAREAFDAYWEHHTHHKGDRSKQFEQWYAINSRRLDAMGNVISAAQVKREFQRFRAGAMVQQQGQWFNYGPINVGPRNGIKKDGGRVKDIAFHPADASTYYVSTFKGGLFKTTNAGNSWTPLTDHLVEEVYISQVDPTNANTIYIGTNLGVLKSTDGGSSWGATALTTSNTNALLIKPDEPSVVVVGNDSGIYRSLDGGASFSMVQSAVRVEELRVHPTNPDIMYAGTDGSPSQFFRSTDGGVTWTENTTDFGQGTFMKLAVTPASPNMVYVINSRDHLGDDSFEGVYRSTDSGVSFTKQSGGTPCITGYDNGGAISRGQPNYNLFIVADPTNADVVYAGGVKSWKSIDGGATWSQVFNDVTADGGGLHLDQLTWAYSPHTNVLFAVNDGGIYYLNANNKFQQITDGLPVAEVWECAQSQTNPEVVAGGTFHCGIKLNRDGVWYSPWGGDEATVIFDYSDDTYAYHFKYEKISRSTDGGLSFQRINPSTADRGEYTGTGVLDKSDVNTLFVGLLEVERINNARTATSSTVWDKISSFGGSTKIIKIEQCDADHNVMYVSRGNGNFYRSDDVRGASPTWTNLTSSLPSSGTITDIATHPTNSNIVYMLQGSKIYRSTNKGGSWTDISTGLPGVALLEMVYDKSSDEGIYVGTDIGVYYKDATLGSWIDYSNGLPAIRVSGMDIYYGATRNDSFLTVSTDGRGFWRTALDDVIEQAPAANFTANYTSTVVGGAINFTDTSTNLPMSWSWSFEGGTPVTSTDQHPMVTYNTPGTYNVTLTVTNSAGNNTMVKTSYITVVSNGGTLQAKYLLSGDFIDSSLYHRDAANTGVVFVSDATKGTVADFDGTDQLAIAGYSGILGSADRSTTAWVKTSTANKAIMAWGGTSTSAKWIFMLNSSGQPRVEVAGGYIVGTTNVADGQWHHVAYSFSDDGTPNTSDIKLYVDGVLETISATGAQSISTTDGGDVKIGNDHTSRMFVGQMNDVRLYSEALTGQAINDIMNNTASPVANFTSDVTSVTEEETVNFTDTSTNAPTSWSWTFTGGTPSTSTAQNPSVVYSTAGTYDVMLTATNAVGQDVETKVGYITVTSAGSGDLQLYHKYENTLNDESSYTRDGITSGTENYETGYDGSAYSVDANNTISIPNYNGISGNNARTVTAWIKTTTSGTRKTVTSWGTNASGQMFNVMVENGNVRVEGGSSNVQNDDSTVTLLDNNAWRHIAVTYDPADGDKLKDVKIYIDGVYYANQPDTGDSFNSENTTINTNATTNNVEVGAASYNANYYWQGALDEVQIYSRALTAQEIASMVPTPCSDIISDSFESGFGNWNDGGQNASLDSNNANSGVYSIRLKGGNSSSNMYSNSLDLASYGTVSFSLSFISQNVDNGESLVLEMSTNGGGTYSTIKTWVEGTDFNDGVRLNDAFNITNTFSSTTVFRLRSTFSHNNESVYIDDVVISECIVSQAKVASSKKEKLINEATVDIVSVNIYPNPAADELKVSYRGQKEASLYLFTINGNLIAKQVILKEYDNNIVIGHLSKGMYLCVVKSKEGEVLLTKRIIKK
ncbi:hypothetical protein GCM10022395_10560 [Snuella lapsa]|uniref:PKD domain-containing protein n=2 Tax=Snuella lapsa TaxID=870481 RepID=A0ABP6X5H3_9FLAO